MDSIGSCLRFLARVFALASRSNCSSVTGMGGPPPQHGQFTAYIGKKPHGRFNFPHCKNAAAPTTGTAGCNKQA